MIIIIITQHPEIGYGNNVKIIEDALRERFGLSDASYVMTAIAAHIWSGQCERTVKEWGLAEIREAVQQVKARIGILERQVEGLR